MILGLLLAILVRPLCAGACLLSARLRGRELAFVLFAGLKGAVPILLGEFLRAAQVPDAERLYGIVVVVVAFSVLVQGGLLPIVVRALRLPTRTAHPEPWVLGVRLRAEPEGVHRLHIRSGAWAEGQTVYDVAAQVGDIWVSLVVRDGELVAVRANTVLQCGDDLVVLADPSRARELAAIF